MKKEVLNQNRLLSKLALFEKMRIFCTDLPQNFESMCKHMVEKFCGKSVQKRPF